MGRVINPNSAGKERNRLVKTVALSIRELTQRGEPDALARDLAAYIVLALQRVDETVDQSVLAWEKRGYWVKADRFRLDWSWAGRYAAEIKTALLNEDWAAVAVGAAHISAKISAVKVSPRHRMGKPWEGAWEKLQADIVAEGRASR